MAEDRKRGAVDRINSAVDTARKVRTAYKLTRTATTVVSTSEIWIPVVIVAVVILILVFIILLSGNGMGIGLGKEESTPGAGSPGSGNISSCQFTRSGQQVNRIKSSILAGWINDAAVAAGIPPAVLASVAMHENPGFLTNYDNNSPEITSNHYCGAEGINCTNTITNRNIHGGACTPLDGPNAVTDRHRGLLQISSYFFPTVDACNITESLTYAATILKNHISNNTPTEDQVKAAVAAYGGFTLGQPCTSHDGYPYDYCDEVWQDYQSCQASPIAPAPPANIRQGLIDSFGITMDGFDEQHLRWAWEKFYETSNTRFPNLVRGITIAASDGGSSQIGCAGNPVAVRLRQYPSSDFFKFMITHELGHVVQSCLPRGQSHFNEAINAYNAEGGISFYGSNASACNGTVNVNENYADIIAYYLNPNAGLASAPSVCGGPANPPNPFFSGQTRFPLSFSVAEDVLK